MDSYRFIIALVLCMLILFGWRRYVDLQHEAELRAELFRMTGRPAGKARK